MSLRLRGHSFNLSRYQYNLTRESFVFRNLYLHNLSKKLTYCPKVHVIVNAYLVDIECL